MNDKNTTATFGALGLFTIVACSSTATAPIATEAVASTSAAESDDDDGNGGWSQWARNAKHTDQTRTIGQPLTRNIVNLVYDPLVPQEQAASGGDLLAHYQAPLVDGDRVFMMFKDADATFDPSNYASQCWGENGFEWRNGQLVQIWSHMTDWKAPGSMYDFWEPVFHPAIANGHLYLPAGGGKITMRDEKDGSIDATYDPFGGDPNVFTVSPITADARGNLYYNAIKLLPGDFFANDAVDSWIVKVTPRGEIHKQSYSQLVPGAPTATDACTTQFSYNTPLPWPPTADAVAPTYPCGTMRVALNVGPAVADDGTIYSVARSHFVSSSTFLVAIRPDLTSKWAASLANRFHDGCGVPVAQGGQLPADGQPGGCSVGAHRGVDPTTNQPGSGVVFDDSTASPVIAPDGSVIYGVWSGYNYAQGHLVHFSARGEYLDSYPFGWDITPAIYSHHGRWSVVLKDNHYPGGSYCFNPNDPLCPLDRTASNPGYPEAYYVTQLDEHLRVEWRFQSTNTQSCARAADGTVSCVSDHPRGFEWCVNAPVVDGDGVVYANSEDGWLYAIAQGGTAKQSIFQQLALGAAYTPTSIGPDGKIYSQNAGHLFVVGR